MHYLILNSTKQKAIEVVKKLRTMKSYNTSIGTCWGAVIAVFAAIEEWTILNEMLESKFSFFSLLNIVKSDISHIKNYYSYELHEKLINSFVNVRVSLLNLNTKELNYFFLNKLSYKVTISILQASIQTAWNKPVFINGCFYIEPSFFDSNCFYHILTHDKELLPTSVDVLLPVKKNEVDATNWVYENDKSVLSRILYIVRLRNLHRCIHEIQVLADANTVELTYNYLDY